jgi:hypothetical protein
MGEKMAKKLTELERDRAAHIVALLSVLIHAWQTDDFRAAADARDELCELGIRIRLPRRRNETGVDHVDSP